MQSESRIVLNGTYRVAPQHREKFISIVQANVRETRPKPGCVYYDISNDVCADDLFHIAEGWADRTSLDAHVQSRTFRATLADIAANVRILARDVRLCEVSGQEDYAIPPGPAES